MKHFPHQPACLIHLDKQLTADPIVIRYTEIYQRFLDETAASFPLAQNKYQSVSLVQYMQETLNVFRLKGYNMTR